MVMSSMMLRRSKEQLQEKNELQMLPSKEWKLLTVPLDREERDVYHKVLMFSKTLFAQFLHQRAEKDANVCSANVQLTDLTSVYSVAICSKAFMNNIVSEDPQAKYFKMRQKLVNMVGVKEIKQHEILVLLLRLRQICCHPSLILGVNRIYILKCVEFLSHIFFN